MADDGSVGVSIMSGNLFIDWMPTAFNHENFDGYPDRFRVIAWRNDTVERINNMIHKIRYPDCIEWLAEGEPITFVKPMQNSSLLNPIEGIKQDEIIVQTDFEGEVVECLESLHPSFATIPAWLVTAKIETGELHKFYALDSIGSQIRDATMKQIANQNRGFERAGQKKQVNWWPYYELQQAFASIRPAYCVTSHKSQGSTFDNVFVDVLDIWANPNKSEALQCLYVACSRASHHLIVNATGG